MAEIFKERRRVYQAVEEKFGVWRKEPTDKTTAVKSFDKKTNQEKISHYEIAEGLEGSLVGFELYSEKTGRVPSIDGFPEQEEGEKEHKFYWLFMFIDDNGEEFFVRWSDGISADFAISQLLTTKNKLRLFIKISSVEPTKDNPSGKFRKMDIKELSDDGQTWSFAKWKYTKANPQNRPSLSVKTPVGYAETRIPRVRFHFSELSKFLSGRGENASLPKAPKEPKAPQKSTEVPAMGDTHIVGDDFTKFITEDDLPF